VKLKAYEFNSLFSVSLTYLGRVVVDDEDDHHHHVDGVRPRL
jgi:hypothetical protein